VDLSEHFLTFWWRWRGAVAAFFVKPRKKHPREPVEKPQAPVGVATIQKADAQRSAAGHAHARVGWTPLPSCRKDVQGRNPRRSAYADTRCDWTPCSAVRRTPSTLNPKPWTLDPKSWTL